MSRGVEILYDNKIYDINQKIIKRNFIDYKTNSIFEINPFSNKYQIQKYKLIGSIESEKNKVNDTINIIDSAIDNNISTFKLLQYSHDNPNKLPENIIVSSGSSKTFNFKDYEIELQLSRDQHIIIIENSLYGYNISNNIDNIRITEDLEIEAHYDKDNKAFLFIDYIEESFYIYYIISNSVDEGKLKSIPFGNSIIYLIDQYKDIKYSYNYFGILTDISNQELDNDYNIHKFDNVMFTSCKIPFVVTINGAKVYTDKHPLRKDSRIILSGKEYQYLSNEQNSYIIEE